MSLSKLNKKSKVSSSAITIKTINDDKILPPKLEEKVDTRPIIGEKLFPSLQANILAVAPKNSGKTVVIFHMIKNCVGPETSIIVFSSTFTQDKTWKAIRKWIKEHGLEAAFYPSIKNEGKDTLQIFLNKVRQESMENDLSEEEEKDAFEAQFGEDESEEDEHPAEFDQHITPEEQFRNDLRTSEINQHFGKMFTERTSLKEEKQYRAPDYLIIFDDLASELKNKSIVDLTKTHRHFNSKTITSTQYLKDFLPEEIRQMDYMLLFRGQGDKLEKIKKDCELRIGMNDFQKIYDDATKERYGFLYIDVKNEQFRKKFDKMYVIRTPEGY